MRTLLRSMSMVAALALVIWMVFNGLALIRGDRTPAAKPSTDAADQEPVDEVRLDLHADGDAWYVELDGARLTDIEAVATALAQDHAGRARAIYAHPGVEAELVGHVIEAAMREPHVGVRVTRVDAR